MGKIKGTILPNKNRFQPVLLIAGILLLLMLVCHFDNIHAAEKIIKVGVYQNTPKVFINEQGKPDGFFINLLDEIAKRENWIISYQPCEWEICLQELAEGKIDLMPDVAYSSDRDKVFSFHHIPAAESWSRVYSDSNLALSRIDQLDGLVISVLSGSIQQTALEKTAADYAINITIISAPSPREVFQLVANHSADAAVINHFFGDYSYEEFSLIKTPIILDAISLYYATPKEKNTELLTAIDKYLDEWRNDPDSIYYQLLNRWLEKSPDLTWRKYIIWGVVGVLAIIAGFIVWNTSLRKQIFERTKHLNIVNAKIKEIEEGYRLLSTLTSDYMFSSKVDSNGNLSLDWVAGAFESITGYTKDEYIANGGWRATLFPEDREKDEQDILSLRSNKAVITEIRTITKSGKTNWVRVFAHPIWDYEKNILTGIYGAVQDITERKLAEEHLNIAHLELEEAYAETLLGWVHALDLREHETADHSRRVVDLTMRMLELYQFSVDERMAIYRGALLHDIGKIAVPDSILLKPGPLTEDEWDVMRQHPENARKMIEKIPYLIPSLDIPYSHHERWDGSGYPRGLSGKDIPLPARIFAVVDVYDALLSDRPYRNAWKEVDVIQYIENQKAILFDPEIVDRFLNMVYPQ